MQFSVTPFRFAGQTAVVAHKDDDGIVCFSVFIQPVHQVTQTFVHTFDQGRISSFFGSQSFIDIFLIEAFVFIDRNMDSVVSHVEEERLIVFFGMIECFDSFERQSFTDESIGSPVFL